jgi:hypothetical protein
MMFISPAKSIVPPHMQLMRPDATAGALASAALMLARMAVCVAADIDGSVLTNVVNSMTSILKRLRSKKLVCIALQLVPQMPLVENSKSRMGPA